MLIEMWKFGGSGVSVLENYERLKCVQEDGLSTSSATSISIATSTLVLANPLNVLPKYFEWDEGNNFDIQDSTLKRQHYGKIFRLELCLAGGQKREWPGDEMVVSKMHFFFFFAQACPDAFQK